MALTSEIVARAYRKIGVAAEDEALTADQVDHGVDALNMMLHAWKLAGVDLSHSDLSATDTFTLDPEYHEGTVYMLAGRISPDYEMPQRFDADDFFRKIQAAYCTPGTVAIPLPLTRMPSQFRRNDYN